MGDAAKEDCLFFSQDRLRELQRMYLHSAD
jgi:hypothetical protein